MTPEQRELARHALGLPNKQRRSYRNRYCAGGGPDFNQWLDMVMKGWARFRTPAQCSTVGDMFWLTTTGARLALNRGERLCPEDFPAAAKDTEAVNG